MPLLAKVKDIFKGGSSIKKKKVYHNVRLESPEDTWEVIGELGDGAYGKVYKALRRENEQLAALKQVVLEGEDDLETFMIEIDILAECKHPNIVELLEAYHYDGKLWMYLEYCDGGAVDSIMVDLDRPLTEPQISTLCYGICNALLYIHSNKVIHRDLKAGNVLLTMDGGVKLADFGVSAKNKNTFDKRGTFIGTPYWLAPEVILCETFIDAKYDYKADIWSLGISLIEFAQMDPPNHEVSPVRVMLKIQKSDPPKLDFPSRWSKEFNDFIAKCLTKDPELRPSAEELLKHPFLCKPIDRKAIIDLLLEYKAEVVEVEEIDEDNEDQDRQSTVPEAYTNSSQFDTESVTSIGKDSTLQSIDDDKLPSPTSEDREIGVALASERRMSKGPAPPPPVASSTQVPPKKGPAPAVPAGSAPAATTKVDGVTPFTSDTTFDDAIGNSTPTRSAGPDFSLPTTPRSVPLDSRPSDSITSTLTMETPAIVAAPPSVGSSVSTAVATSTTTAVTAAVTHIPRETKSSSEEPTKLPSLPELEANAIDSLPVAKSVVVFDANSAIGVVPSTEVFAGEDVKILDESRPSPFPHDSSFPMNSETSQSSAVQETNKDDPSLHFPSPGSLPVTLSVVTPSKTASLEGNTTQHSDVVLASISSEGTVIVRTPTPTSAASLAPSGSLPEMTQEVQPSVNDSVVTYTVAGESETSGKIEAFGETTIPVSDQEKSQTLVAVTFMVQHVSDSPMEETSLDSLGEAESQAVQILETAINSALDASLVGTLETVSPPPSPPAIPQETLTKEIQGEVVVVASVSESDISISDTSGHRLDQSEVLISSSSIPEDEQKTQAQSRLDIAVDEKPTSPSSLDEVATTANDDGNAHVSVVAVAVAEEVTSEVTIVNDESIVVTSEVVVDESGETTMQQVSLTIEGTTVEDTDVDEVESPTISQAETLPESSVNAYPDEESVVPSEDNSISSIATNKAPTTGSPSVDPVEDRDKVPQPKEAEVQGVPLKPIQNGVRRQNSRASDRSDTDTTSTLGSDKENRHTKEDADFTEDVTLRRQVKKASASPATAAKNLKNKELQESIALRKKTRKRTRKFVIDGVVVTTTTSKVIYGDDEEQGMLSSAHLKRKQELRELKLIQKREQKQFQDLALKANIAKQEQEKKFEIEKANLLRNYDSQIENLIRQQKQMVEKAEGRQESELKVESKKIRIDQERELKVFRESLKQEWKLLKQEIDLLPKERRKENFKIRKEQLEKDQAEREKACLERLNDSHEMALKRLNDKHRQLIALKERQFLEEKHQLLRTRESALWDMEERHIQDKHQLAKEQLKDIYFLQRLQMTLRHNTELEQVRRYNQQKEEDLIKRQQEERRQLPKRIRQEMKTREKMFREQIRISMTNLASHDQEKDQLKKFQGQEKIKYDKERKRAEMKHKKQMEELKASSEASIKELVHLQNEKGKLLTEHETYKLRSLDDEYQKELKEWKSNLAPRKQKLEEDFERQLKEQENFYGDYLDRGLGLSIPSQSTSSLASSHR